MRYTKPELNVLGSAEAVIRDFTKCCRKLVDPDPTSNFNINPAYDLDE